MPAPPQPLRRQSPRRRRPAPHIRRSARRRTSSRVRLILAGSALIVACIAWAALARAYAPSGNTSADRFDAIIVLGGGVNRDGNPTPASQARVTEAVHEYERGVAPRLILTGFDDFKGLNEARTMARAAQAQGIPAQNLVVEPFASNTIQNACFSARIMQQHGWRSAEVVTSAAHLPRAELIFSAVPIRWRGHAAPSIEPQSAFMADTRASSEVLHTVYYLVFSRWAERCSP